MKDLIIIGAGPAGMSAAIYGKRAGLDLTVIEKFAPGGQLINTYEVENYPGFKDPVSGFELVSAMEAQALRFGTEIVNADVASYGKNADGSFTVKGSSGESFTAKSLILAMGSAYRKLGIPGEQEFIGSGVSYCATCDGAFYREKITVVVGGGSTALEEALFLTRFASKVYLVHRRDAFRSEKIIENKVRSHPKIEMILNTVAEKVNGQGKVESVTLKNILSGASSELAADGFFVFIGYDPQTSIVPKELLDDNNQIKVDFRMRTSIPGLFAAGDIRTESPRQIVNACADGASAAMSAYQFLNH